MQITIEELNELLHKEYERGRLAGLGERQEPFKVNFPNINDDYILEPCKSCPNHPSNGDSGICHCILGDRTTYVGHGDTGTYVTTATHMNTAKDKIQYTTNFIKHFLM